MERRLEKLGKGSKKINKRDEDNTSALHYAVRYNHFQIVKLLLEFGAGKTTELCLKKVSFVLNLTLGYH